MNYQFGKRPGFSFLGEGAVSLPCNPAQLPHVFTLFHEKENLLEEVKDDSGRVVYDRTVTETGCVWYAVVDNQIRVEIAITVGADEAVLTWQVDGETENMHLVTLRLEGMMAVEQTDASARIVLPNRGGRLIDPAVTQDGQTDHRYNWILDSFGSCAFAYTKGLSASVRVMSMDDMITSRVGGETPRRYAQLGLLLRHRYTVLDSSYRRAMGKTRENGCEDTVYPIAKSFTVGQGEVRFALTACEELPPESGWVPAALRIHRQLPGKRTQFYKGIMIYKLFVGSPTHGLQTTYRQMEDIVRTVYKCTGGVRQLVYIVGFQHGGHDDMYPDVKKFNTAPGSLEELTEIAKRLEKECNALISFHDNYDDAYMESPSFDANLIARDNTGHLLRGGVWNGKQAYWISLPQYAKGAGEKRLKDTFARYPFLHDSYHLDVLTASVFRLDFRLDDPAGRQRDLEARVALLNQFRDAGMDVTSEACGLPFLGVISYFWHMMRVPRNLYEGDQRVPVVPFLAHGKADYAGTHTDHPSEILDGLLYGGFYCNDVTAATPIKHLVDAAIMLFMPLDRIRNDSPASYQEKNGWKIIRYASGAEIAVNFETLQCRVDIDGQRFIENGTAMIPQENGDTLVYVSWEEPYLPVCMPCKAAVGQKIIAHPVSGKGADVSLTMEADGLPLELPVGVAYRIHVER